MPGEEVGGFDAEFDASLEEVQEFCRESGAPYYAKRVAEARARLQAAMLPGWICKACGAFSGDCKERLSACRACGLARR
jgi:hypothetical protein